MKIGLVLGAGGVTGEAFHRGVLRALHDEAGVDGRAVDVVVGTSAGSLVAAALRAPRAPRGGRPATRHLGALDPPDERLSRGPALTALLASARRPWAVRVGVLATSLVPPAARSTDFLCGGLRRRFGDDWPERALLVPAVCRRNGRWVVFGSPGARPADVASAVAASCAIPGIFAPVRIGRVEYVDGAVHSPANADVLADADLDLVVVSSPMSLSPRAVGRRWDLPARLHWHRYLAGEARALRRAGTRVIAVEPDGAVLRVMGLNLLDGRRIDDIEDLAYERVLRVLAARRADERLPRAEELATAVAR